MYLLSMYNIHMRIIVLFTALLCASCTTMPTTLPTEPITYVPIGDSYTEGTGVQPTDAWPVLLTEHLAADGYNIALVENLGKSGWRTDDAITGQLPRFKQLQPNFGTLFLGANDLFQGVPVQDFATNYELLITEMLTVLPSSNRLLLITIPDYSFTPVGIAYGRGNSTTGLTAYNNVILSLAEEYNLPVADIHSVSKKFLFDVGLVAEDGLHPSRRGHELWEEIIYKVATTIL